MTTLIVGCLAAFAAAIVAVEAAPTHWAIPLALGAVLWGAVLAIVDRPRR